MISMKPTPTIAVCGLPDSFSEVATHTYLEQTGQNYVLDYFSNAAEVVKAVRAGAALGIVPTHNSVAGDVAEAGAIPEDARRVETVTIPVRHQLMVRLGTTFEGIKRVVSHEQALAQCGRFLAAELPDAEKVPYADTAQAAQDLSTGELSAADAVIASLPAAERNGLEVLQPNIQDTEENRTSFLVFALSE